MTSAPVTGSKDGASVVSVGDAPGGAPPGAPPGAEGTALAAGGVVGAAGGAVERRKLCTPGRMSGVDVGAPGGGGGGGGGAGMPSVGGEGGTAP